MKKLSEKTIGDGKMFVVKIEKLRTDNGNYKTLNFTIHLIGKEVYNKNDVKKIYD